MQTKVSYSVGIVTCLSASVSTSAASGLKGWQSWRNFVRNLLSSRFSNSRCFLAIAACRKQTRWIMIITWQNANSNNNNNNNNTTDITNSKVVTLASAYLFRFLLLLLFFDSLLLCCLSFEFFLFSSLFVTFILFDFLFSLLLFLSLSLHSRVKLFSSFCVREWEKRKKDEEGRREKGVGRKEDK